MTKSLVVQKTPNRIPRGSPQPYDFIEQLATEDAGAVYMVNKYPRVMI